MPDDIVTKLSANSGTVAVYIALFLLDWLGGLAVSLFRSRRSSHD